MTLTLLPRWVVALVVARHARHLVHGVELRRVLELLDLLLSGSEDILALDFRQRIKAGRVSIQSQSLR